MTKNPQIQQHKAATRKKLAKIRPSGGQNKCSSQNMSNSAAGFTCWNSRPAIETWTKRKPGDQTDTVGGFGQKREKERSTRETKTAHTGADKEVPGYCQGVVRPGIQA